MSNISANNNNNNNIAGPRAERVLAQSIMSLVLPVAAQLAEEQRDNSTAAGHSRGGQNNASSRNHLSDRERSCLNKFQYLGYGPGFAAAALTLGGLFGGLRYAAYRRFVQSRALPGSVDSHAKNVAQRKRYTALDKVGTAASQNSTAAAATKKTAKKSPPRTKTSPTTAKQQQQQQQQQQAAATGPSSSFRIVDSADLWTQLQLLLSGVAALFAGSVTAHAAFDATAFFRNVSQLPLQPGPSEFCERLCPLVLEKRQELLALETLAPLHEAHLREHPSTERQQQPLSDLAVAVRRQRPAELWNFPATEQLESAVALAENCQRRMEFVEECRRRKHRIDAATGLVNVPEPGVPAKFVRLEPEQEGNDE